MGTLGKNKYFEPGDPDQFFGDLQWKVKKKFKTLINSWVLIQIKILKLTCDLKLSEIFF